MSLFNEIGIEKFYLNCKNQELKLMETHEK